MYETDFKARLNNHNSSFRHRHLAKTSLARHIWSLKDEGKNYTIKWSIHRKAAPYQCGTRKCDLCLTEKAVIARADQATLINARSELAVPCPHRRKYRFDKSKACRWCSLYRTYPGYFFLWSVLPPTSLSTVPSLDVIIEFLMFFDSIQHFVFVAGLMIVF